MNLKKCSKLCIYHDVSCPNEDCRYWINFSEDLNCTFISIKRHGAMTLREVARRTGVSFVRIKQIEKAALAKIKKMNIFND
tara:strand:+ start:410 stop:652 length:243 start_codon:yes stop_codon:yes gene_type:complete